MIIAISGTPGTGKTSVAKQLAKNIGYKYVSLNDIVLQSHIGERDETRDTIAVDEEELKETLDNMGLNNAVIDGLMSYAVTNDVCIVLRCRPEELRKRLAVKKWPAKKVDENVEAEMIGFVVVKALESCDNVFEIDTTYKTIKETAKLCSHIAVTRDIKYAPGKVDWME